MQLMKQLWKTRAKKKIKNKQGNVGRVSTWNFYHMQKLLIHEYTWIELDPKSDPLVFEVNCSNNGRVSENKSTDLSS